MSMNFIHFPRYSNFRIETNGWGEAIINDIIALLENVTGITNLAGTQS